MNYEQHEIDILSYFGNTLPITLAAITASRADGITLPDPNEYVVGYPDPIMHPSSVVLYLVPSDYTYKELTQDSQELTNKTEIYVVLHGIDADLTKISRRYAEAIHGTLVADRTLGGIVGASVIEDVHFFDAVEGIGDAKAIKITMHLAKETE